FCNLASGRPRPPDPDEPIRIARAAHKLGLDYVVLTSPTRDDLPDGLAAHFAATIMALKWTMSGVKVEVLIPDFQGSRLALDTVLEADPDVVNHNLETVPRLYPAVRPGADYDRSLELLREAGRRRPSVIRKSGLMVGLGEESGEIEAVIGDLAAAGVKVLTIGQYLAPSPDHLPVVEYHSPNRFEGWREMAEARGLVCQAGPLVRSSFGARRSYLNTIKSIGFQKSLDNRFPST
ncbi:MAG: lipoyl synthase, partial [Proteobacteria bacterium]|nr:lipoyl synthase [Pseudomonadota bacterium]